MVRYRYTPEALAEAAATSHSITGVMRALGVRISGGSHAHISRQLKRFGIDTSHFTGSVHNRGQRGPRKPSSAFLVKLPDGSGRTSGVRLRRALLSIGVPDQCEHCGVGTVWRGRPLILHVDHINGDCLDNRPPNLRLLCPNCHSQTATYAGRNRRTDELATTEDSCETPSDDVADSCQTGHSLTEAEVTVLITRFDVGTLEAAEVARILGCRLRQVYRLRQRLQETGTIASRRRSSRPHSSRSA